MSSMSGRDDSPSDSFVAMFGHVLWLNRVAALGVVSFAQCSSMHSSANILLGEAHDQSWQVFALVVPSWNGVSGTLANRTGVCENRKTAEK